MQLYHRQAHCQSQHLQTKQTARYIYESLA